MYSTRIPEDFKAFRSPSEDAASCAHNARLSSSGDAAAVVFHKGNNPEHQEAAATTAILAQSEVAASAITRFPATAVPRKSNSAGNASKKNSSCAIPAPPASRYAAESQRPLVTYTPQPPTPATAHGRAAGAVTKAATKNKPVTHNGMLVPRNPFCFSGLYEDVDYKVDTLFAPPVPANAFPARVRPPRRPGPTWKNNLDEAGAREHAAQMKISKIWRGVLLRRELSRSRTFDAVLNARATKIQCWWRCVKAIHTRQQLAALKQQWIDERGQSYVRARLTGMANMMTWQRRRYEQAASLLQETTRWHQRWCERQRLAAEGCPKEQLPEELPAPVQEKTKIFFPWRRNPKTDQALAVHPEAGDSPDPNRAAATHTLSEAEVAAANEKMRARELALTLPAEEIVSRTQWKQDGLRKHDFDFNAGVLQRAIKRHMDSRHVRSEKLTSEYMNKVYRIISRSFRIHAMKSKVAEHRRKRDAAVEAKAAKYIKEKLARIKEEGVWGRSLQEAAALTIQQCWFWYRYHRFNVSPGQPIKESTPAIRVARIGSAQPARRSHTVPPSSYKAGFLRHKGLFGGDLPVSPPYHLMDEHIEREQNLRRAEMPAWQRK